MKKMGTVLKFEFLNFAKSKSFIILTVILMLATSILLSFPRIQDTFFRKDTPADGGENTSAAVTQRIALVDTAGSPEEAAAFYNTAFAGSGTEFIPLNLTRGELVQAVEAGEYEAAILLTGPLSYTRIAPGISMSDSFAYTFQDIMLQRYQTQQLAALNLSPDEISGILHAQVVGETVMTTAGKDQMQTFWYTYALNFILYIAILTYGQFVSSSVATEKSTRAMELLITSTRPVDLILGKVLGTGLAGLSQFALILVTAFAAYNLNAAYYAGNSIIQSLFDIPLSIILFAIVFFILGFFIYAFLYAALASLVSRMEDLATTTMPVTYIFIAAFMVTMMSMASGSMDNTLLKVCSFIPLTSPMAMFARIAMGNVAAWEIILSILLLLASAIGIGFLAAGIYRLGVLLYGKPPKIGEVFKMLKKSKTTR